LERKALLAREAKRNMTNSPDNERRPAILIVDDDKEVLISFKIWLQDEGLRPLTTDNSQEALKIVENDNVEVALLDFRLGTENGLEMAKKVTEIDENVKVIIITGYPSYDTAVESIKSGLFDYLSKGASNEKILETIKKAIRAREREMLQKGDSAFTKDRLKLIVICRHSLILERLDNFSSKYPAFKLVRTFASVEQLAHRGQLPEIDIAMVCATCCIESYSESFSFLNNLYKSLPYVKPVLFNDYFSEIEKVELIRSGVKGFFSIDMDSDKLEQALRLIKKGEMWVSRKLISLAVPDGREYLKERLSGVDDYGISDREKEILKAMVLGLKNREIADKLFISEMTVKSHLNRIFKKLGVKNRTSAIRFIQDNKIL
jgi:DNA-binding NarL/FixJ family response regulator